MSEKSLNQRIFEEVLEPMFPGEFRYAHSVDGIDYKSYSAVRPGVNIESAFWLAEKVGLFNEGLVYLTKSSDGEWLILTEYDHSYSEGKTIPEAICLAVLEVYRKEG